MIPKKELWQKMADLTSKKCRQKCKILGSCCDPFYCDIAEKMATAHGIKLERTGDKIPFLNNKGTCIVPPYLRPMCSLHQCDISNIGVCIEDPDWTKEYFRIRETLNEIRFDEHSGMW